MCTKLTQPCSSSDSFFFTYLGRIRGVKHKVITLTYYKTLYALFIKHNCYSNLDVHKISTYPNLVLAVPLTSYPLFTCLSGVKG